MKRTKIMKTLRKSCGTYDFCRCWFGYHDFYRYYYILDYSEKLFLGAVEDDFILDGFEINRLSDIDRLESKDDGCIKINRRLCLLDDIEAPEIDLTSWRTVFESLAKTDLYVIIQNRYIDSYHIGKIREVRKNSVVFKHFDAFGVWQHKVKIPFSEITSVRFADRYSTNWKMYLCSDKSTKKGK